MKIAVACGGTGGHVLPGLCMAQTLRGRGHEVTLWMSGRDVEVVSARNWDGPIETVPAEGFASGLTVRHLAVALCLLEAVVECRRRMRSRRPDVLLAMGSYASVGPVVAARLLGVPIVLHEANAVPGRAVQALACLASSVGVAFRNMDGELPRDRTQWTGLPLRADVLDGGATPLLEPDGFTVLAMGGSQGSERLNAVVSEAVCRLHAEGRSIQVVHLTGKRDAEAMRKRYREAGVRHAVYDFLEDMSRAYAGADLAIARSGAATCAELAARRVPSLLVPLPSATRDHQRANAAVLEEQGGAEWVEESELSVEWLCVFLGKCMQYPGILERMRAALEPLAVTDGADRLADLLERSAASTGA